MFLLVKKKMTLCYEWLKKCKLLPQHLNSLTYSPFCVDFLFSCGSYVKSCLVVSSVIWTSCPRLTCSCMTTISQEDNVSKVSMMLFYFFDICCYLSVILYCLLFLPSVFFVNSLLKFNEGTTNWYFTSDGQNLKNVHILQFDNEEGIICSRCVLYGLFWFKTPTFLIAKPQMVHAASG